MMTAAELKISQAEFDALVRVRDMLARREVKRDDKVDENAVADTFDMNASCSRRRDDRDNICGTIMCIGGWMKVFMMELPLDEKTGIYKINSSAENKIANYVWSHYDDDDDKDASPLAPLFFPPVSDWERITPYRASKAITNFLETGKPSWSKALA